MARQSSLQACGSESEHKGDFGPSFAILTDAPNDLVAPYHDRMPVIVDDDQAQRWMDLSTKLDDLEPLSVSMFGVRAVNRAVNYPRCKDIDQIEAV